MDWKETARSRSEAAASMTLENLTEGCENVYLWTFTFSLATDRKAAAKAWNHFMVLARQRGIDLRCVRVFEVHPGGHGIHIHFITPDFHHVNRVRPLATRAGFGRIDVQRITASRASYVLKYINKAIYGRTEALKGAQRWRAIGRDRKSWAQTVRGIHLDSLYTRAWHWLKANHPKWMTIRWFEKRRLTERTVLNGFVIDYFPFVTEWEWVKDSLGIRQFVKIDCPF